MSRFQKKYLEEVVPALTKEFGYKTTMEVPRIARSLLTWVSVMQLLTRSL